MAKRHRRLGTILGALGLALVMTGPASAALTPRLSASTSPAGSAVSYSQAATDDPVAKITYYVPSGFTALLAQPAGEVVGTVSATALAADLGNATPPAEGHDRRGRSDDDGRPSPGSRFRSARRRRSARAPRRTAAFWILNLTASGQTLQVPAYVDDVPLDRSAVRHGEQHDPDLPPAAGRARGHAGRVRPSGRSSSRRRSSPRCSVSRPARTRGGRWSRRIRQAGAPPNPAGTIEAQSVDRTPQQVTVAGRAVKGRARTVRVTGRVRAAEGGVAGARVQVLLGTRVLGRATTRAGGVWTTTVRIPTATALLRASATYAATSAGTCTASFPPVPCASKTFGGFVALSPRVRVRAIGRSSPTEEGTSTE